MWAGALSWGFLVCAFSVALHLPTVNLTSPPFLSSLPLPLALPLPLPLALALALPLGEGHPRRHPRRRALLGLLLAVRILPDAPLDL